MRPAFVVPVLALFFLQAPYASPNVSEVDATYQMDSSEVENKIFDRTRVSPLTLLRQLYEERQVLVIAAAGHDNATPYNLLDSLLSQIGKDTRLKYVVFERPHDNSVLLEELSVKEIDERALVSRFASTMSRDNTLCASAEWAHTWGVFLKRLRTINAKRLPVDPIRVTSVDGISSTRSLMWPLGQLIAKEEVCDSKISWTSFATSTNRELETNRRFSERIWKNLHPSDKVIVIYHHAHSVRLQGVQTPHSRFA